MFERNLLFREISSFDPDYRREINYNHEGPATTNPDQVISELLAFQRMLQGIMSEQVLLQFAWQRGVTNPSQLTNLLFWARHPQWEKKDLGVASPETLKKEWGQILKSIVRPFIANPSGGSTASSGPLAIPLADIKANLDGITVVSSTKTINMLRPWEIFRLAPNNYSGKIEAYSSLKESISHPEKLQKAVAETKKYLKRFNKNRLEKEQLEKKLSNEKSASKRRTLKQEIQAYTAAQSDIDKEIDDMPDTVFQTQDVVRKLHTVTVDGEKVTLYDAVDAYATIYANGFEAKTVNDPGSLVADALKNSGLSASRQTILKAIAHFEGSFTTINQWDIAMITWGFVQWTGAKPGADLTAALEIIKTQAPAAFRNRFQRYGIDVVNRYLSITSPDGTVVQGDNAAMALIGNPKLTAAFSRAGLDPEIIAAQIKAGNELEIVRPLNMTIKKDPKHNKMKFTDGTDRHEIERTVSVREIITSEYGVATIANTAVHAGPGRISGTLARILSKQVRHWPDLEQWKGEVENSLIDQLKESKRDEYFKDPRKGNCRTAANTFT